MSTYCKLIKHIRSQGRLEIIEFGHALVHASFDRLGGLLESTTQLAAKLGNVLLERLE